MSSVNRCTWEKVGGLETRTRTRTRLPTAGIGLETRTRYQKSIESTALVWIIYFLNIIANCENKIDKIANSIIFAQPTTFRFRMWKEMKSCCYSRKTWRKMDRKSKHRSWRASLNIVSCSRALEVNQNRRCALPKIQAITNLFQKFQRVLERNLNVPSISE